MKYLKIGLLGAMGCLASSSQAQMLSNQGALISVVNSGFVAVYGNSVNNNQSTIDNKGTMYLFGDATNTGNSLIENQGTIRIADNLTNKNTSTIHNPGSVYVAGDALNQDTAHLHTLGLLDITGNLTNGDTATVTNEGTALIGINALNLNNSDIYNSALFDVGGEYTNTSFSTLRNANTGTVLVGTDASNHFNSLIDNDGLIDITEQFSNAVNSTLYNKDSVLVGDLGFNVGSSLLDNDAFVHFSSNFTNFNQALVYNKGIINILGNSLNSSAATFDNQDTINLYGNWDNIANNEAFVSLGIGVVRLKGADQSIGGTSITRFYDLRLENTGIKYALLDVYVDGFLRLNDREFNVDTHLVHVFNPNMDAVEHTNVASTWGFVSALQEGGLLRHTNSSQPYFYPVGSALSPARFRPVVITPADAVANAFRVRMANIDATNEGFDRAWRDFAICAVNPSFYHRIGHTVGNSSATVGIYHDPTADGTFTDMAKWFNTLRWEELGTAALSTDATYNLSILSQTALQDFNPTPFALSTVAPSMSINLSANPICADDTLTITATGDYPIFDFYIDTTLVQTSAANLYTGTLSPGNHLVWAMGDLSGVCGRYSDTVALEVFPFVNAQASADTIIVEGTPAHLSASGGDFYEWSPSALVSCSICDITDANPTTTTVFTVLVTNIDGCSDTASVMVTVQPDAGNVIFIPNALTPNNDGKNDTWFIKNLDLFPSNDVVIVNRWGDVVYKAKNYANDWTGDYAGGKLPPGTYYYVLDLGGEWGIFKGDVTVIRE